MDSFAVLPSLPVPEITIARGAGCFCAENQTRSLLSNQSTFGTGRAHGMEILISCNGTFSGMGAMSCGGVPNTVARSAAESARPVAGPLAERFACTGGNTGAGSASAANSRCGATNSARTHLVVRGRVRITSRWPSQHRASLGHENTFRHPDVNAVVRLVDQLRNGDISRQAHELIRLVLGEFPLRRDEIDHLLDGGLGGHCQVRVGRHTDVVRLSLSARPC